MATNWEDLVAGAERKLAKQKKNREPYVLNFKDEPPVSVKFPDGQRSMDYEEAESGKQQLRILLGRDFQRVWEKFKGVDVTVVTDLIRDMWRHWDDESEEVPGGKEDSGD